MSSFSDLVAPKFHGSYDLATWCHDHKLRYTHAQIARAVLKSPNHVRNLIYIVRKMSHNVERRWKAEQEDPRRHGNVCTLEWLEKITRHPHEYQDEELVSRIAVMSHE